MASFLILSFNFKTVIATIDGKYGAEVVAAAYIFWYNKKDLLLVISILLIYATITYFASKMVLREYKNNNGN